MAYTKYNFTLQDKKIFTNSYYKNDCMNVDSLERFYFKYTKAAREQAQELENVLNKKGICIYQYLIDWQMNQPDFEQGQLAELMEFIVLGIKENKINIYEKSDHRQIVESFTKPNNIITNSYKKIFDNRFYLFQKVIELNLDKIETFIEFLGIGNTLYPFYANMQNKIKSYVDTLPKELIDKYSEIKKFYQSLDNSDYLQEDQFAHYRITIDSSNFAHKNNVKDSLVQKNCINTIN